VFARLASAFFAAWLALSAPADSGLHYKAEVSLANTFSIEVRVAGDRARLDIQSSNDPSLVAGTTLLTPDRGDTFVVVDSARREYFSLPRSAIVGFKQREADRLRVTADPISSEKIGEDQGPYIAGYSTRHLRFHLRLASHQARGAGDFNTTIEVFEHFWLAGQLPQHNTDLIMLSDSSTTGLPALDAFLRGQLLELPGFLLKRSVVITTDDSASNHRIDRSSYEVKELAVADSPPEMFQVAEGFHVRGSQATPSAPPPAPGARPR